MRCQEAARRQRRLLADSCDSPRPLKAAPANSGSLREGQLNGLVANSHSRPGPATWGWRSSRFKAVIWLTIPIACESGTMQTMEQTAKVQCYAAGRSNISYSGAAGAQRWNCSFSPAFTRGQRVRTRCGRPSSRFRVQRAKNLAA